MLPVLARTVLGLYRSTASVEISTASAPNASAQRITVPRLPGSRTWSQNTTRRASGVSASASGTSTVRQTASTPCGVTVSVSSRDDRGRQRSDRDRGIDGRPQQILVVIDGRLGHQQPTDDADGGQRLRDGLATLGQELPCSQTFLATQQPTSRPHRRRRSGWRDDRLVGTEAGQRRQAAAAVAGWFALATSTRATNAAGSVTARSARILRSTSTSAVFRPEMKRL